jgi:hypothetical protein
MSSIYYTSGKISHDPSPNIDNATGRRVRSGFPVPGCTWAPRPEFDNHNPILAYLRASLGHYESFDGEEMNSAQIAADWLDHGSLGDYAPELSSPTHINHARRVLTKLAALS